MTEKALSLKDAEENFAQYLAKQELKFTSQRKAILEQAFRMRGHFSADKLLEASQREDRGITKATLYRTLTLLKECEILEEQDFGDGYKSYEKPHSHHDHLVCLKCGKILEFKNEVIEQLQDEEARKRGFELSSHSHKLFGTCRECRSK